MSFRQICLLLAALLALLPARAQAAGDWKLVKHQGRDHVTVANIANFYGFTSQTSSGNSFRLATGRTSLSGSVGSVEILINGIKFIMSYPAEQVNGQILISRMDLSKLIEPVLRPGRIQGGANSRTIILDAGHGGHDTGARGLWGNEKNFTLDVANRARDLLTRLGYQVKMTRSTDRFIPLHERAAFANRHPNALFISIHFNSSNNRDATGIETFTLAPRGVPSTWQDGPRVSDFQLCAGNARDAENMVLATAAHASMLRRLRMPDRGIKRARFVVIREIKIPGVLLEGGFVTHSTDSRRIASPAYRQEMAYSIVDAVKSYRTAVSGAATRPVAVQANADGTSETPTVILQSAN